MKKTREQVVREQAFEISNWLQSAVVDATEELYEAEVMYEEPDELENLICLRIDIMGNDGQDVLLELYGIEDGARKQAVGSLLLNHYGFDVSEFE